MNRRVATREPAGKEVAARTLARVRPRTVPRLARYRSNAPERTDHSIHQELAGRPRQDTCRSPR